MNQECWTAAHVNAYKYFCGVTRIIQCDNLKQALKKGYSEFTLNKNYLSLQNITALLYPCNSQSTKDKAMVEGTVG
jgi:hypothetical protein